MIERERALVQPRRAQPWARPGFTHRHHSQEMGDTAAMVENIDITANSPTSPTPSIITTILSPRGKYFCKTQGQTILSATVINVGSIREHAKATFHDLSIILSSMINDQFINQWKPRVRNSYVLKHGSDQQPQIYSPTKGSN